MKISPFIYEIDPYLVEIFEAYAQDADSAALLSQLRTVARVKGAYPPSLKK